MEISYKAKGLSELNKELKRLPEDFRAKSLNGAVGAATRILRDKAIANVPVDTGNLKTAIRAQKKKSPSKYLSKFQVNIKPRGRVTIITRGRSRRSSSTFYAKFIEDGTSKQPARPFMRPAFQLGKEQAVQTFQKVLDRKVKFYQRKLSRIVR